MIVSMCASTLIYWRASSVQAAKLEVKTELELDSLRASVAEEKIQRQSRDKEISESLSTTSIRLQQVAENQALITGILQGKGLIDKTK
jgi:hypothetical protein